MNLRKIFRRTVSILFAVSIMLFAAVSHAEIYTGEGSYVMSKVETLEVARERAKADAMRNATEKAGVYVKSYSRSINFELDEDVIETMTANILKLIEKPIFQMLEEVDNLEGVMIRVTVKVQIDDSDITRWLNKDEHEKSTLVSQNEALRKANEEQARQIAELKRQLANNLKDTEKITKEFAAEDKIFLSNQKVEEAWKLYDKFDFERAIKLYSDAIELNPNNSLAYYSRGLVYSDSWEYNLAIDDFSEAIAINPNYFEAYNSRGLVYSYSWEYNLAIDDFSKAIVINPNYFEAYNNRGNAYYYLGQYERAIQDYSKAIQLNTNYSEAYNNRGLAYQRLKQYERAIQDFDKAIAINSNHSGAYYNRGLAYQRSKQYERAIQDFNKVIKLDPFNLEAYTNRKECLKAMGK